LHDVRVIVQHPDGRLPVTGRTILRIGFVLVVTAAAFAACLDDKNDPLQNEAPNRYAIFLGGSGGSNGSGGGSVDTCECATAFVTETTCSGCAITKCAGELSACAADGGAGPGGGSGALDTCVGVRNCVNACTDGACALNCIGGASPNQAQQSYAAFLTCACGACGSKCSAAGASCNASGGSTTTSTLSSGGS
jgi:hypothetical protein